jgi:integrase/recombinase XerD
MTPLRQRMLEDMQVRNLSALSAHTRRAYLENVAKFAHHFGRSPAVLGPEEIRAYLVYLTTEKQLAPSSVVIAVCALRFSIRSRSRRRGHSRPQPRGSSVRGTEFAPAGALGSTANWANWA